MLGLVKYADATYYKNQQLSNIITFFNTHLCEKKVDSALADLIDLAADRGMRGQISDKLISKDDDIQHLFDMEDN